MYLIINNSLTSNTLVEVPQEAMRYTLTAETMRSTVMLLNGRELSISGVCDLPDLTPEKRETGLVSLAPGSCTFLVL